MDDVDRGVIGCLMRDGRATYAEVGAQVGLSASAVKRRVDRLLAIGVLRGFTALVDPAMLGPGAEAYVEVYCRGTVLPRELRRSAEALPETVSACTVSGAADMLVHLRATDVQHLEQAIAQLRNGPNVDHTESVIVLSRLLDRSSAADLSLEHQPQPHSMGSATRATSRARSSSSCRLPAPALTRPRISSWCGTNASHAAPRPPGRAGRTTSHTVPINVSLSCPSPPSRTTPAAWAAATERRTVLLSTRASRAIARTPSPPATGAAPHESIPAPSPANCVVEGHQSGRSPIPPTLVAAEVAICVAIGAAALP